MHHAIIQHLKPTNQILFFFGILGGLLFAGCSRSSSDDGGNQGLQGEATPESSPVTLALKWPHGQPFVQRVTLNEQNRLQLPGRPNPLVEQVAMTQEYATTAVATNEDGSRSLEETIQSTKIEINVNGRPILNLDTLRSEGPEGGSEESTASVFRRLIGMSVVVDFNASNHVEKISGKEKFNESILSSLSPQARSILGRVWTEEFFGQLALPSHLRDLPYDGVLPGDTWSSAREISTGSLGKALLKLTFQFTEWEERHGRHCARLKFQGTWESLGEAGSGRMGMKTSIDRGTVSGLCWFDPELGMAVESHVEQSVDMTLTMNVPKIGEKGGGTRTMDNQVRQTLEMRLLQAGDLKL